MAGNCSGVGGGGGGCGTTGAGSGTGSGFAFDFRFFLAGVVSEGKGGFVCADEVAGVWAIGA